MFTFWFIVIVAVAAFVGGILVGRKNRNEVEIGVALGKKAGAEAEKLAAAAK